jgi:hypothetical protein
MSEKETKVKNKKIKEDDAATEVVASTPKVYKAIILENFNFARAMVHSGLISFRRGAVIYDQMLIKELEIAECPIEKIEG